ncbi:MAG: zinc-ribbon domain-containing protein [Cyclobacteriaceae bacterium]|nr:zinc-ribbon domain-containing protein [Cyclobacteriaceae bacterium]
MFCKNCGIELTNDIKYCPECGAKINIDASAFPFY